MQHRKLLSVLSIGIAFGLVAIGLSFVSATRAGITTAGVEVQPAGLQDQSIPVQSLSSSSPGQTGPVGPSRSYPHPTDALGEQMRLQVMQASPGKINPLAEVDMVGFWNNKFGKTWMWGTAEPTSTIDILTSRGFTLTSVTDVDGNYGFSNSIDIFSGDVVTVSKRGGTTPVVIPIHDPIDVSADSSNQTVFGHVGGWALQPVGIYTWWGEDAITPTTDLDGNFVDTFTSMPRGARGHILIEEQIGSTRVDFYRIYYDIMLQLRVNSTHEWIEGDYEVGTQIWITVTNDLGDVKATAHGVTSLVPWWGDNPGFTTDYNVPWDGARPDMQFGDWVYVRADNGKTGDVHIGEVTGNLDVNADMLTGTLNIPWQIDPVHGSCGVWVSGGPGIPFYNVDPHGGSFICDFSTISPTFDLQAGMDIGVDYRDPEEDQIYTVFRAPAPNLWINTWGNNDAAQDSNYELFIEYNNNGDATAQGVVISQTLLTGMTYLGDTSGFHHMGTGVPGNPLMWSVGDLPPRPGFTHRFRVFVQVTALSGETIAEAAQIKATVPYFQGDEGSMHSYWEGQVIANNTHLNIGKGALTGDPAPGTDFVYNVNLCNNGNTASSQVIVTDSLPLATTLVDWWAYNLGWQEISRAPHKLIVARPTAPGYWCEEVYIKVHLDENAWGNLRNRAWVWAENDLETDDNFTTYDHGVGSPHTNLSLYKNWIAGQLVPGGQIGYEFSYANNGNIPIEGVLVTQTLPVSTSFEYAYSWDAEGQYPITPTIITPHYLVWDIGTLMNGFRKDIGVWLRVDPQGLPGTILTHLVKISPQPLEDFYDDNVILYSEKINGFGPNLRVDKANYQWNSWWEGNVQRYQLQYELRIMNLGSQRLENVWITDTYPVSATFDSWWQNHGPWITMTVDAANHLIKFWVEKLDVGESASVGFRLEVESQYAEMPGAAFPNQLDAPITGDVDPADNHQVVTAHNGPDVFVHKWLSGGIPKPGELITFTVEFGNANKGPWSSDPSFGSHITETLPAGMTLVEIIGHGNPQNTWLPEKIDGNTIVWHWGPMWSEQTWTFDLVARFADDLLGGQILYNQVEAYGDSPYDVDYNLGNNVFVLPVEIIPFAGLELTPSSQARTAEPGESVEYTFILTNTGDIQDTFTIAVNGGWVYHLSTSSSGPLLPGASFIFTLTVNIPPDAADAAVDDAVVTVRSTFDSQVKLEAHAVTTVEKIYYLLIPLVITTILP